MPKNAPKGLRGKGRAPRPRFRGGDRESLRGGDKAPREILYRFIFIFTPEMKKSGKYLSGLFLWIAIMAIIAHGIIPHDHHSGSICAQQEESCPESGHEQDHHSGFPIHCHVLNDITSEKTINTAATTAIQQIDLFISLVSDDFETALKGSNRALPDFNTPPGNPCLLECLSLRAPPALG